LALWEGDILIDVGKLNRRITIEGATSAANVYGEPIKTWARLTNLWAEVLPLSAREQFQAQQVNREISLKVRIHYRTDVTEQMRLVFDGNYYDIQGITEIGFREGLELLVGLAKPEGA